MASSRSKLTTSLATLLTLAAAGGACWFGAHAAAGFIEERSREEVAAALQAAGKDWVTVTTDGLQVRLTGTAPTEVDRFRAVSTAGTAVDSSRIVDAMSVTSAEALTPPAFKIELLRNDDGISVIGLIPAASDRDALIRALRHETAAPQITDLLETADHQMPENWQTAVQFGIGAAQMAPRAKISIEPGAVTVSAITDSRDEKGRLETALQRSLPAGVTLKTDISAPRPVISPFTLRFLIDENGARFDACAADNEEGRDRILAAANAAGIDGIPGCTLGLGAPTPHWADGAVAAIGAIAAMGEGTVTLSDADIALTAPASVPDETFRSAVDKLQQELPPVFSLHADHTRPEAEADEGPVEFTATLAEDQSLTMRGRIPGARMREAVDSIAKSRFASVQSGLTNDDTVPSGWTVSVIGALEALDELNAGSVQVTPEVIRLSGTSGNPAATEAAAARLAARLGAGAPYELSIRYDRHLDPALDLPDGPGCVQQLNIIMSETEIGFEPSKAAIAGDPAPTLDRISQVMTECSTFQIEAGGHTDSQGSEGFNADLSRGRAQALVTAMREAGIDVSNMTSRGYGESQPIATNETEEGREENRRIEFRLLSTHPVRNEPLPAPVTITGTTVAPEIGPAAPPVDAAASEELTTLIGPMQPQPDTMQPDQTTILRAASSAAFDAISEPVEAEEEMQGPVLPFEIRSGQVPPAMVGASEEFLPLDVREENITLPVQTPDEDTPRPSPRPGDISAAEDPDQTE
ncbi:OmpA family protein [Paracoccus caeni]|uniref:OmpA family protein n=1 Tax=Paracoccus caeni TaxID=657651 RepID=A0A934W053_9RHOB|nr:OmpA family protein [Paracoccus caeni]MBK4217727.1 OmpA family protein [Paracoccus caeni]